MTTGIHLKSDVRLSNKPVPPHQFKVLAVQIIPCALPFYGGTLHGPGIADIVQINCTPFVIEGKRPEIATRNEMLIFVIWHDSYLSVEDADESVTDLPRSTIGVVSLTRLHGHRLVFF